MLATWGCATFPKPTLDLQFAGATSLDSRITFTRASTATYFNSAGVLTTANNDVARFDYDPSTFAARGLLIEEARTNSIRNNTMQGAVAGTPGTLPTNWSFFEAGSELTSAVVATGTENGITYIDIKVSGTVTAQRSALIFFEPTTGVGASASQSWTQSLYLKLQAGSTANIEQINIRTDYYSSVPAFLSSTVSSALTVTSAALNTQRQSNSVTTPASTAFIQPMVRVRTNASGAIDITLRIGLPQLELGAFATSVIPTTTTALTRNADVATMTGTNFSSWYNASEGTLFGFGASNLSASKVQFFAAVDTNTQNYISLARFSGATGGTSRTVDTNSIQADMALGTLTTLVPFKLATAYKVNNFASSTNGAAAVTDTAGIVPTVIRLSIGSLNGTLQINGYIQRIAYYPSRLPDTTLQALTA